MNIIENLKIKSEADRHTQKAKYKEAVSFISKSIRVKETAEGYARLAWAYFGLRNPGDPEDKALNQALELSKKAVALDPTYVWSHAGLGRVLLEKKKANQAVEAFDEAIRLDPEDPEFYRSRGYIYEFLGEHASAEADHAKARKLEE